MQSDAPFSSATAAPTTSPTTTEIPTETPSETLTPTSTDAPTVTPTPTATRTPFPTAQDTPGWLITPTLAYYWVDPIILQDTTVPGDTGTDTPTPTETQAVTETPSETPTPTVTDTPTETYTPTLTETPTETPMPSETPAATETETATDTPLQPNGEAVYVYDGDGNLVKSVIGTVTTYYPSQSYEKRVDEEAETILPHSQKTLGGAKFAKYYFAGSVRIAVREDEAITWLLADHLGSTSVTADAAGNLLTTLKYTAFGEQRPGSSSSTDYQYTGQRNETETGLYYYVARYYDPELGRFISADTIIPEPVAVFASPS